MSLDQTSSIQGAFGAWIRDHTPSSLSETLSENWGSSPEQVSGGKKGWVVSKCTDIKESVLVQQSTGDIYPISTATKSAVQAAAIFFGARPYFGFNMLMDVPAGITSIYRMFNEGRASSIIQNPRELLNAKLGKFVVNFAAWAYAPDLAGTFLPTFLVPGFVYLQSNPGWLSAILPSSFFVSVASWTAFGYALYNPNVSSAALKTFQELYHKPVEKPVTWTEFKVNLGWAERFSAVYEGRILPSDFFGTTCLGNVKDHPIKSATIIGPEKEE